MSPTVLKYGPYRFYFLSNEPDRPHVHCERDSMMCKFWLEKDNCPKVSLKSKGEFSDRELGKIQGIIEENHFLFLEKWYGHFRLPLPDYEGCP